LDAISRESTTNRQGVVVKHEHCCYLANAFLNGFSANAA